MYHDNDCDTKQKQSKWSLATTQFQRDVLSVCGRQYFRKGEKSRVIAIEKAMVSISTPTITENRCSIEYVQDKIAWARGMNKEKLRITLQALLNGIEKEDNKTIWMTQYNNRSNRSGGTSGQSDKDPYYHV